MAGDEKISNPTMAEVMVETEKQEMTEENANGYGFPTSLIPHGVTPLERAPRKNPLLDDIQALPPAERMKAYAFYRKAVDAFEPIESYVNKTVEFIGAAHYPATVTGRDGKLVHFVRAVFMLKDGKAIGAASDKAADFARELTSLFGVGPWDFAMQVKIGTAKTRQGSTYTFEVKV